MYLVYTCYVCKPHKVNINDILNPKDDIILKFSPLLLNDSDRLTVNVFTLDIEVLPVAIVSCVGIHGIVYLFILRIIIFTNCLYLEVHGNKFCEL